MGRSYGDASLAPFIVSTCRYNKMLHFDDAKGELTCQAGVSLDEILQVFVPRGWFPYVTPGTKYVTVAVQSPPMCMARTIAWREAWR